MIVLNLKSNMESEILKRMHDVKDIVFYLTGSRFFGNSNSDSDWDFYCKSLAYYQLEILNALGFERENMSSYNLFGGVKAVYKYERDGVEIHILEVHDIHLRLKIQNIVLEYFPNGYSDKNANAKGIWKMAETIARKENV